MKGDSSEKTAYRYRGPLGPAAGRDDGSDKGYIFFNRSGAVQ